MKAFGIQAAVLLALSLSLVACDPTVATSQPSSAGASSIEGFRDAFIGKLKQEMPELTIRAVDEKTVRLLSPSGGVDHVSVENAYRLMLAEPSRREELLSDLVKMVGQVANEDLDARPERLAIIVRPADAPVEMGLARHRQTYSLSHWRVI